MRRICCESFEFGEGVFEALQSLVEDTGELTKLIVRVGNRQALSEIFGSYLPGLLSHRHYRHERASCDKVAAESCQQDCQRRCEHKDFDNLRQGSASVGFVAE